jgi:molybdopterin-containing oxidoreductase family iron-sulfur binding subunit
VSSLNSLWRSLEQAADDPAFLARAQREFPGLVSALDGPTDRREVLKLMGAALLWSGLAGCDSKFGKDLIPAVRTPPGIIPGQPNYYATAHALDGYANGVVVKHVMGRPIKVDGNPLHPASLGSSDAFAQALPLDFYDPDRAAGLSAQGAPSDRPSLDRAIAEQRDQLAQTKGRGLRILMGSTSSPTLAAQLDALLVQYPEARHIGWDPVSRDAVAEGAARAYGRPLEAVAHLDRVDVLLALDSDLLSGAPGSVRYARDFAARRNPTRAPMSRVYALESTPTLVGAVADHRFIATPGETGGLLRALAARLSTPSERTSASDASLPAWFGPLVEDLKRSRGRALVHVGRAHPAALHALGHVVNESLNARGATFDLIEPVRFSAHDRSATLSELVADMREGRVTSLVIIDSNPVYAAPAALGFKEALARVPFSLALAPRGDETARATTWFVPLAHPWESWSDARAYDGSVTLLQPQSLPLYRGMSAHELLARYTSDMPANGEEIVRSQWRTRWGEDFDRGWRDALAQGLIRGSASTPVDTRLRTDAVDEAPEAAIVSGGNHGDSAGALQLLLRPDPSLWDGRFANNPWLQELPRPLTKLVWDNPLLIAPQLADRLGLKNGDHVRLAVGTAAIETPVWTLPGQAPDCVTALLGSGRAEGGRLAAGGVDFYPLTGAGGPVTLRKATGHTALACTEHHNLLFAAPAEILRHLTLHEYSEESGKQTPPAEAHLYRRRPPGPAAWAMSIDLNACIGCNACIIACQAENNIPVVGKAGVLKEREMHWLRIDRYYSGTPAEPESFFQPVLCMHCEEAPCENVCPVGATLHDSEGLNVMVYNRCVGTRFCSNNCPYKVRRFNFFAFAREQRRPPESFNPDVTVRARGVMEKCSYCIQRIAEARIEADRASRPIGEVRTACQTACPTQAFTFGNLADPESDVVKRKQSPLGFAMLAEQNTQPRTTYEARVRNPNPAIEASRA